MEKENEKTSLEKFHENLHLIFHFQLVNQNLIEKLSLLIAEMRKDYKDPELHIFQTFLKEMNLSNKLYKRYLNKLFLFSEDVNKKGLIKNHFINDLFDYSQKQNFNRNKKIQKKKPLF